MFMCCSSLTKLNISNFDTSIVTNMFYMFHSCINLQTIYVSDAWTTDLIIDSSDMFLNCSKLIGGAGTVYDPNCIDSSMAHIDGGADNPGYLTDIANKN
jgi:surface protein